MNYLDVTRKHEFVLLFDVKNGNPNGDPDSGNLPRTNPLNSKGWVTDACIKRKIRNYAEMVGESIFIRQGSNLNDAINEAVTKSGAKLSGGKTNAPSETVKAQNLMCQKYWDVRTFGAVMSTGHNAGQVRGAWQIAFAESIDPILTTTLTITRCAAADKNKEREKDFKTMGKKEIVPYALYRCHGFFSAHLAAQCGFSEEDMSVFVNALKNLFEFDRSASRGEMNVRGLWMFSHKDKWGSAPTHKLFDAIAIKKREGAIMPECFGDYEFSWDSSSIGDDVEHEQLV